MSVQTELQRIIQAKADIVTSIENKGVTVPAGTKIDNLDDYVDQIQQGGGSGEEWAANECFWIQPAGICEIMFRYKDNNSTINKNIFNIWYQITDINAEPDDNNWTKMTSHLQRVNANKKIWLYGENLQGFNYVTGGYYDNSHIIAVNFNVNGLYGGTVNYTAGGHLMSLISKTKISLLPINAFTSFFIGNAITDASNIILPNSAPDYCYSQMFKNCTALTAAPVLPATTVGERSYYAMFQGCTTLTTAPALPATTLASNCYNCMFSGCTSLVTVPVTLPATTLVINCYMEMFYGCTSLTTAPDILGTTVQSGCCQNMFRNCTALTAAPNLPAITLAGNCYSWMFGGCTSLTTAPDLPATTLISGCYNYMFNGCTNLNYIKAMFTTTPSTSYTNNWLYGVAATGTFVKNANATWTDTGVSAVPDGWTVETAAA